MNNGEDQKEKEGKQETTGTGKAENGDGHRESVSEHLLSKSRF